MKAIKNVCAVIAGNIRDFVAVALVMLLATAAILALANPEIRQDTLLGVVAELVTGLVFGTLKFAVCCALAWVGLCWTYPEAGRMIFSRSFDDWWRSRDHDTKVKIGLLAAAVLVIVAAMCMQ